MSFNVFISYRREDLPLRAMLAAALDRQDGITSKYDEDIVEIGGYIHEAIIAAIDECHCVVAILTPDAPHSQYVRDELSRAHDRGLPIIPLKPEEMNKDHLPWFLRDRLVLPYRQATFPSAVDDAVLEVQRVKKRTAEIALQNCIRDIRRHVLEGDWADYPFKANLAQDVLDLCRDEIAGITGNQYATHLAEETNFLVRASPIFRAASGLYATSIDDVSTFWSDEAVKQRVVRYVQAQPSNSQRLFIFSEPEVLQRFGKVLDAHARRYGVEGRVFVISKAHYRRLIPRFAVNNDAAVLLEKNDFGFLEFDVDGETRRIHAHLNDKQLAFSPVTSGSPDIKVGRSPGRSDQELCDLGRNRLIHGFFWDLPEQYFLASVDGRLRRPRSGWGACSAAAKSRRKVFNLWLLLDDRWAGDTAQVVPVR